MQTTKVRGNYPTGICLNLCTACNLNCTWCYNQAMPVQFLNIDDFNAFFQNIVRDHIEYITLIGGEPTVHPDFLQILKCLEKKKVYLVSNGIKLSDINFLNSILGFNVQDIAISLKGYDDNSFYQTTCSYDFPKLCEAIHNLQEVDCRVTYSYTYSGCFTLDQMRIFTRFLLQYNIREIVLNDVRLYFDRNGKIIHSKKIDNANLEYMINNLENHGIKVLFKPSNPLCDYNEYFIQKMVEKSCLISRCAIKLKQGVFFSSLLECIPCNEFSSIVLGTFKEEFATYDEFIKLWNSVEVCKFYDELSGCPSSKCSTCNLWTICGGNCILHWMKDWEE